MMTPVKQMFSRISQINVHLPSALGGVLTGAGGVLAMSSITEKNQETKERAESDQKKKKALKEADRDHNDACWDSFQRNKNLKAPKKTKAYNKAKREAEKAAAPAPAPVSVVKPAPAPANDANVPDVKVSK